MVELGKLLLTQKPSLSIHILITSVPYDSGSTAPYIANVAATIPSIKFHYLPTVTLPSTKTTNYEELTFEVLRLSNPHVREQVLSISKNYTIHGLVVDFFCCAALNVAKELNIPGYHFSTSGAGILAVFHYFPTIHNTTTKSLKDLKYPITAHRQFTFGAVLQGTVKRNSFRVGEKWPQVLVGGSEPTFC
ncbi:hypothetical protein NC651_010596 [Populus alba x Populus x berolinensis]|nr:hypothetical protein NC651_010596 [Populus alba x Populus x berolinensis]